MTRPITLLAFLSFSVLDLFGQPYTISTVAGTDRLLDGGSAASAPLRQPRSVAADTQGNVYIADTTDNRIRKVTPSGTISTYAGTGAPNYSGDRGKAALAALSGPTGVATDLNGNVYIADRGNFRVRRITPDGTINTVAGTGISGFSGDSGQATSARVAPVAVTVDTKGNLYIADGPNYRIRKVDLNGIITTIAGVGTSGFSGDNGPAISALIGVVTQIAVDSAGNIYLADLSAERVRKIDTTGMISTIAGHGDFGYISDGAPANSSIMLPAGVVIDGFGNLLISDLNLSSVRRVDLSTGLIFTIAGNGSPGFLGDNGAATNGEMNGPSGLAVDGNNQIYVADLLNARVRKIAGSVITTLAGTGLRDGSPATSAFLNFPEGLAVSGTNTAMVADTGDVVARRFSIGGAISTVGQILAPPHGVAADQSGNFYVTDDEPLVLKITPAGVTSIVAGNSQDGYTGDNGPATAAMISMPTGVAVDSGNNVYITDFNNSRIRKISASGTITTIAGNGKFNFSGDNGPALLAGMDPFDIAVDTKNNLYVADQINNRIRKITPDGTITTVAGTGAPGYAGDGGPATSALLNFPTGIAVDNAGNLYIVDGANFVVRRVNSNGLITTIAGNGSFFPGSGDGGPAISAAMAPYRIAVDTTGAIYITDSINDRVRKLTPTVATAASMSIVSGNNQSATTGTKLAAPLVVKVVDTTGAPLPGVVVSFTVNSAGAATVAPSPAITLNDGTASATVTFGPTPGAVTVTASATGLSSVATFSLTAISSTAPSISAGGIVSAGLSTPPVNALAPNAIATVFGSRFAPDGTARQVGPDDLVDGKIPTNLAGVCVGFGANPLGSVRAPVFGVYPGQINFQVPSLPAGGSTIVVTTNCDTPQAQTSNAVPVIVQAAAPEFFYFLHNGGGHNPIAALNAVTGTFVGAAGLLSGVTFTPAQPGDILTLFATGFGVTDPAFSPGELPDAAAQVTAPVSISLGGVTLAASDILYVGVTQNAGLYQVNLRVPDSVPDGDQALIITIGGAPSPAGAFITISRQ
jgi:trimeric autotransporter adhesin